MAEISLGRMGRYERRIRAIWSAEPQRGLYVEVDDEVRSSLAKDCAAHSLDYWAKMVSTTGVSKLPGDKGSYVYAAGLFNILGLLIVAFPSAAIRDIFVKLNAGAEVVPDDKFWP